MYWELPRPPRLQPEEPAARRRQPPCLKVSELGSRKATAFNIVLYIIIHPRPVALSQPGPITLPKKACAPTPAQFFYMRSILSMLTNLEADTSKGGLMKEKDLSQDQLDIIQSAFVGNFRVRDVGKVGPALTATV